MIVLHDTWNDEDDQELIDYLKDKKHITLSTEEILKLDPKEIKCLFCDTKVVQELLAKNNIKHQIDTYPEFFKDLYLRKISKMTFGEVKNKRYPYFVKPDGNDKKFNGQIVEDDWDFAYLKGNCENNNNVALLVSEPVRFVNEWRLFLTPDGIRGMCESSKDVLPDYLVKSVEPMKDFIEEVSKNNKYGYCIVDIAYIDDTEKWAVVEVNPPYAIMSYGYPIEDYFKYCCDAWSKILKN